MEYPSVRGLLEETLVEYVADKVLERHHPQRKMLQDRAVHVAVVRNGDALAMAPVIVTIYILWIVSETHMILNRDIDGMRFTQVIHVDALLFAREYVRDHWQEIVESYSEYEDMLRDILLIRGIVTAYVKRFIREEDWFRCEGLGMERSPLMRAMILYEEMPGIVRNPWDHQKAIARGLGWPARSDKNPKGSGRKGKAQKRRKKK